MHAIHLASKIRQLKYHRPNLHTSALSNDEPNSPDIFIIEAVGRLKNSLYKIYFLCCQKGINSRNTTREEHIKIRASFKQKFNQAISESDSFSGLFKNVMVVLYHTTVSSLLITLFLILNLYQIVTGGNNFNNCPKQQILVVYIFVNGWVGLLKSLHLIANKKVKKRVITVTDTEHNKKYIYDEYDDFGTNRNENREKSEQKYNVIYGFWFTDLLMNIFLAIWFVFGNFWIIQLNLTQYNLKPTPYEPNNFCAEKIIQIVYINLIVYYIIFLSIISYCVFIFSIIKFSLFGFSIY